MNEQQREDATLPERVAQAFHWHYERLAARHGYTTREESAVPWDEVPAANRALMVETVEAVLREMFDRWGFDIGFELAAHFGSAGVPESGGSDA